MKLIFTLHRNLGVFHGTAGATASSFGQWQGKDMGFTKGGSIFSTLNLEHGIVGMISHLGPQLSLAGGVGLWHKPEGEQKVALAFTEMVAQRGRISRKLLNVAAVWQLPVNIIIENNGYWPFHNGTGTVPL